MSYTRILVALNDDPTASEVFGQALDLAGEKEGASLMIFHCLRAANVVGLTTSPTDPLLGTAFPSLAEVELQQPQLQQQVVQQQTEQSFQWLETYRQQALARGVPTEISCQVGSRSTSICDLARDWPADLIVLGRGDLNGWKLLFQGSVSTDVVHEAPCSVLVV
jgi:nucleotide-binding universal stress UspA family protein